MNTPVLKATQLGILLLTLFLLQASPVLGQGQASNRKIVYLRASPSGGSDLWVMNPDGSGQTKVCTCTGATKQVLSPDGLKIAFEMANNVWVVNTDGTGLMNLTANTGNYDTSPTWSPDSTQIAFDSDRGVAQGFNVTDIYRMNADGTNVTRLTTVDRIEIFANYRPAWSPDGSMMAFVSTRSDHARPEVYVMSSNGGAATRLTYKYTQSSSYGGFGQPVWSPDSRSIVSMRYEYDSCGPSGLAGFYIVSAAGGPARRITDCDWHNGTTYQVAWSPNSKKLAFRGDTNQSGECCGIYTMNPDGSAKRRVGLHASSYYSPVWSPDGKKIVYAYDNYPAENYSEIYAVNADGTGQVNLTNTQIEWEFRPEWGRGTACDLSTIPPPPIQPVSSTWPYDLDGTNPNWSMTAELSAGDGLVLKDIRLGQRYLAKKISVPYYNLHTSAFPRQRGKLKPDSSDSSMRSRLVDYAVNQDDEKLVVEASYAIDQIAQSCLQITQRYEFYKEGVGGGCEPSDTLACSRWKPIVDYQFMGKNGETLTSINIAQRQHKRIDNNAYNTVGLFKDCDSPPSCGVSAGNTIPGLVGFERKSNPLYYESYGRSISRGQNSNQWDNIHQTYRGRISEPPFCWNCPNFVGGGCPECDHSHWRWGATQGPAFSDGRIIGIPSGSDQDLDFAVMRYQSGEEDPNDVQDLVQTSQLIRTYSTSGRSPLQIHWGSAPEEVVLWYSGTGYQNSDAFFGHGGFFNPTITNKQLYGGGSGIASMSKAISETSSSGEDGITSIAASEVFEDGSTTISPFDASLAGPLPTGYSQYENLSYDVATTAESSGPYTLSFSAASITDPIVFANLRIFHLEQDPYDPDAFIWVDRTVVPPDPLAPDFASKTLNARANLLGQFVLASLTDPQPPTGIADIALSFTDSPDPIVAGSNLTYTLSVTNNGPQMATGIRLADPLPHTIDFVSVTSSQGTCKQTEGSVVCKLDSINSGATATISIVAKAGDGGFALSPQGQTIHNTAYVQANEDDADPVNNTATAATTILPDPNTAPTVSITSPANGSMFAGPANVVFSSVAQDIDGTVSTVEFFDNGTSIGFGSLTGTNEYTLNWSNVAFGTHSVLAMVTDNAGKTGTSAAANIVVNGLAYVSVTSPVARSEFVAPANVTIEATATRSGGSITQVDFYANGTLIGTGTLFAQGRYRITWSNVYSGSHLLTIAATDNTGAVTVAPPVTIFVNLRVNQSPVVNITSPAGGAVYTTPATVTMTATATDSDGSIRNVDFYADGSLIGSGTNTGPNQYSFTWPNVALGDHVLKAIAADNQDALTDSSPVAIKVLSPALLVAGSTTLNTSDAAVKTRMEALNFSVTVKDGATATTADATGKALVVISSTVTPTSVGTKFRNVAVPVVTWESGLFANMGMTGSTNKDFGTKTSQTQVSITNPAHPLAGGFPATVIVSTASTTFNWGKPNANAATVATVVGDATKVLIFGYENGVAMPGLTAPARRVGLFMHDTTAAGFTSEGTTLVDAALQWARGGGGSGTGGTITGSFSVSPVGSVNLTSAGVLDWAHWGRNGSSAFDHKKNISQRISNITKIGTGGLSWFADCPTTFSWTDGTPTLSATNTPTGINTNGSVGNGFEITVPADTNLRTLKLYVGVWYTQGKMEATLSDGSAPVFIDTTLNRNGGSSFGLYTINFKAGSSAKSLKIRFTILNQYFSPNGNVALEAATLQ